MSRCSFCAAWRRATLRRAGQEEPTQPTLRYGDLEVDLPRRLVTVDGEQLHLTPTEYSLLEALVTNPGKLLTHQLGDGIGVIEDICIKASPEAGPVELFLRDVSTIDDAGWQMLRRLSEQGVGIRATGVYISYVVKGLRGGSTKGAKREEGAREHRTARRL
jgi:hypothetical protein